MSLVWEKCDEWRLKFPGRAAALRLLVAQAVGIPAGKTVSPAAEEMCKPVENKYIAAIYGLKDEP